MLYLIDGYNLLFRFKTKKESLQTARDFLLHSLGRLIKDYELKATIVFDSSFDLAHLFPSKSERPPLEVIFCPKGMSADDYLIEMIGYQSKKIALTLVTSDRELKQRAKEYRIPVLSIEALMDTFSAKARAKTLKEEAHKKELLEKQYAPLFDHFLNEFEKRLKNSNDSTDSTN